MPAQVHTLAGLPEISREIASRICAGIEAANKSAAEVFGMSLHGGRSAKALFEEFARQARARSLDLRKLHLFWGDERCVPPTDSESNFLIASEALIKPLGIPAEQVHRILGEAEPEFAARQAEAEICRVCPLDAADQPVLDVVLLGMGEDGHIASLFPNTADELANSSSVYVPVIGPKPPPQRISLAFPAIAAARSVYAIATGEPKREALLRTLSKGDTPLGRCIALRSSLDIFTDLAL